MTISLSPETEAALVARAAAAGVQVDRFVADILDREASFGVKQRTADDIDEFFCELRALSSSARSLADPNFTRNTIYQNEHEE